MFKTSASFVRQVFACLKANYSALTHLIDRKYVQYLFRIHSLKPKRQRKKQTK